MATFDQLKTRVLRRLIDAPAAVQAEVPDLVNSAMNALQIDHDFKAMEFNQASTTVASTRVLFTPARFKKFRTNDPAYLVPQTSQPTQSRRPVRLGVTVSRSEVDSIWNETYTGEPRSVYFNGTDIEVWPLPDSHSDYDDGQYRIVTPFYQFLAPLVNSGDRNWLTDNAAEYIIFKATAEGFAVDWDEQRMAVWEQKAAAERRRAINVDKILRLSGMDAWVPHYNGDPRYERR